MAIPHSAVSVYLGLELLWVVLCLEDFYKLEENHSLLRYGVPLRN